MDTLELVSAIQKEIVKIYKENSLTNLSGLNDDYKLNDKQILVWHSEVTRKCWVKNKAHFDYQKNLDDILFCSDEILHFTAHLYLYRPYINNPLKDGFKFSGGMLYPNYQNLAAKRYSMYSDVVSQSLYNYWDRIGDLIASFFPDEIKTNQIYFGTALANVPSEFQDSSNLIWLKKFNEGSYKELNQMRKEVVHYTTSDTAFKHAHLETSGNREKMEKLQHERESLPDFYKAHIDLTLKGFELTLLLLEEISAKKYADVK